MGSEEATEEIKGMTTKLALAINSALHDPPIRKAIII
jgi:hypothetical protein